MANFNKIPTILGMMFLLTMAVSCEKDDYYSEPPTENGNPDHRGYGKPIRPRVCEKEISIQADGHRIVFTLDGRRDPVKVSCRNISSGETIHSIVTAESPVLEIPSEGVWEVEVTYAGESYHEIVDVKDCATATE